MSFEAVSELENKVAEFFGSPYAVAVDCCTHGIELCLRLKHYKKIKDPKTKKTMRVDMFTASAITQVYDAVKKTSHKSKFESLPLDKMAQLSFKMMK